MRHHTLPTGKLIISLIAVFLLSGWLGTTSRAETYSTQDGLSVTEDGNGRITNLTIGGIQVSFGAPGNDGGFYVRDNTGLPAGVSNEIVCGDFGDTLLDCEDCLGDFGAPTPWQATWFNDTVVDCDDTLQPTPVARVEIDEGTPPSWGLIYQDVTLPVAEPTEHELYYLHFEMATECGWRPQAHPFEHDPNSHDTHRVVAYVEWFNGTPTDSATNERNSAAITISSLEAFHTSIELTPFALRTYRPLDATDARIKLVVEGFMPNDGRDSGAELFNFVYFDNVAFFKAPDVRQVEGEWDSNNWVSLHDGVTDLHLDMKLEVTPQDNYILFEGELKNTAEDENEVRALDFGFALPIIDACPGEFQRVEWYDDNHTSYHVGSGGLEQTLPFRMVGPADLRLLAGTDFVYSGGDKTFVAKTNRHQGLNISAYPFSSIKIGKGGYEGGLGFGDNLKTGYPPISHFGYRVENPAYPFFIGWYYVEFSLGLLDRANAPGQDTVPFSFVLFRSDIPGWSESSSFRAAAEKYQTSIFPEYFTRPTNCDDDWLFGGGQFSGYPPAEGDEEGYHYHPNDFGFRYARTLFYDKTLSNTTIKNAIKFWEDPYQPQGPAQVNDVDILVYDHPWSANFENSHVDPEEMNLHSEQVTRAGDHTPSTNWDLGDIWDVLYEAALANQILLPGVVPGVEPQVLFTKFFSIIKDEDDNPLYSSYSFPVLLADKPLGGADLLTAEMAYIDKAYTDVSMESETVKGLGGMFFDNMFFGEYRGLQLDILDEPSPASYERHRNFFDTGGSLTYSLSHLKPAISVIPLNVNFLDQVRAQLTDIDQEQAWNYGGGTLATSNTQDEILTGNPNTPSFGASKYGIVRTDVAAFESSPVLGFNNNSQAFDFQRTLARQRNMARLFMAFPCIETMPLTWDHCEIWRNLWGHGALESMYRQIANEAIWLSLAWGFHPSITNLLPENSLLPGFGERGNRIDLFVENHIREIFTDPTDPTSLTGYTTIFKQLHLAGWKPITSAVAHDGEDPLPLFVERFGPISGGGESNGNYFTVLNNDDLTFTLVQLNEDIDEPGPQVLFEDLPDLQALNDTSKCDDLRDCTNYPEIEDAEGHFDQMKKNYYLEIHDPIRLGLWNGNLHGRQMVNNPDESEIINWPEIIPGEFDETPPSPQYSITRNLTPPESITIGGYKNIMDPQESILIEDKALMVFKIWTSLIVNNGPSGGGGGEQSGDTSGTDDALISSYFERYGQNWQRLETDFGYGGNLDIVPADNPLASVFYKFTIGLSGSYRVMAHIPETEQPPAAARYEAYLLDYFEDHAGATPLGDPVWSNIIDLTGSETYNNGVDEEGFMEIGTIDIVLVEPELATVVIRLSAGETSSRYLLADAVKLVPMEGLE